MFEAFKLKAHQVEQQEEILRSQIGELDKQTRKKFYTLYSTLLKDPDTYAVLNFFFLTGLHHFYLKNLLKGSLNLSGFLVGLILIFGDSDNGLVTGFSFICLIILIEMPALFRSQIIVKHYNNRLATETLIKTKHSSVETLNQTVNKDTGLAT